MVVVKGELENVPFTVNRTFAELSETTNVITSELLRCTNSPKDAIFRGNTIYEGKNCQVDYSRWEPMVQEDKLIPVSITFYDQDDVGQVFITFTVFKKSEN